MDSAPVFHPARSRYFVVTTDYLLPILVIAAVITSFWLVLYSQFFHINSITCSLDYQPCTDPIMLAELDKLKGQNIFRFDPHTLQSRLTSGDYTIRSAEIKRELPGSLIVSLQSVYPVVALQVTGQSSWIVLDGNFRVIGTHATDPNVPTVIVNTPLTLIVGRVPTDPILLATLNLAKTLASERLAIKSMILQASNSLVAVLPSGIDAIFTTERDTLEQIKALQAVLSDATLTKGVHTIDVRFARPVLR